MEKVILKGLQPLGIQANLTKKKRITWKQKINTDDISKLALNLIMMVHLYKVQCFPGGSSICLEMCISIGIVRKLLVVKIDSDDLYSRPQLVLN